MERPCYICYKIVFTEGDGPPDFLCQDCRTKSVDPAFVRTTLHDLPCIRPHCSQGTLRAQTLGSHPVPRYYCSGCDFSVTDSGVLALIVDKIGQTMHPETPGVRQRRQNRLHAYREAMLSDEDRCLLRMPGVPETGQPSAPTFGRTGANLTSGLRHGDEITVPNRPRRR